LDAAELLVDLSASGEHIVPAPERVLKYLLRAVELGSVVSARILAEGHIHGFNWEFEKHNVRKVLEFHAKAGDSEAQRALGHLLCRDGNPGDEAFVAGHSWFALAADAGDADAQAWIGDGCKTGLIGRRDEREAEQWYRKAAGQGHFGALLELGLLLEKYEGAEWDLECFGIWLAAASYGSNLAQRKVGVCYLEGKGCDCDAGAATRWFQAAADQGDREAQYLLGRCFRDGIGVERSETMAKMWLERAHHKLQIG
jgi:TPR repeat protein